MYPAIQMKSNQSQQSGRMVSTKGLSLPLIKTSIEAIAYGGIARVVVKQTFQNTHEEALSVTYQLPLPSDGAVSGFSFLLQDRRVIGEVDRKAKARERFQRALSEGRSAALLEQDRSSVFTQEIGNIPPKSEIEAEVCIDQKLLWLPDGQWEWRFPTVVAPKYLGEPGRVKDAAKIQVEVSQEPLNERLSFSIEVRDGLFGAPSSPSHALRISDLGEATLLSLGAEKTRANQDVVVRWPVASSQVGARLSTCRPELGGLDHFAFGLLTLVPPAVSVGYVPRDLILLLDISGSMSGAPIHQLKEVSRALINSLREQDQLELIAFADNTKHWKKSAVSATEENKSSALSWINGLQASGGTEMKNGIIKALKPIRPDSQRQVIVMTDGHIGYEDEIVREVFARLPMGSRVHTLGVGSSINRSLTTPVARAGNGVEQIVGLNESAQKAAARLLERTNAPVVVGLRLGGDALIDVASSRLPDLFAASPALLSVKLKPEGGSLWVEGYSANGLFRQELQVKPMSPAQGEPTIAALYAREAVEDLELGICAGKKKAECDQQIEEIGVAFQIATRLTSWIAISKEATVDPELATRHEVMPQELPDGMNAAALGLRPALAVPRAIGQSAIGGKGAISGISVARKTPMIEPMKKREESSAKLDESFYSKESGESFDMLEEEESIDIDGDSDDEIQIEKEVERSPAPEKTRAPLVTRTIDPADQEKSWIADKSSIDEKSIEPEPTKARPTKMRAKESRQDDTKQEKKKSPKPMVTGGFTGTSTLRASGTITKQTGTTLCIVFDIPAGFFWRSPSIASLTLPGGVVQVRVDAAQSTAEGAVASQREVRLVFVFEDGVVIGAPTKVSFSIGSTQVQINIA
jgi:Ca-activated chloride channel family protein